MDQLAYVILTMRDCVFVLMHCIGVVLFIMVVWLTADYYATKDRKRK
jgi:hypothetical protein